MRFVAETCEYGERRFYYGDTYEQVLERAHARTISTNWGGIIVYKLPEKDRLL